MTLYIIGYIIGYIVVAAVFATVIYGFEKDLLVSILYGLIWPWLFLLAVISKLLT